MRWAVVAIVVLGCGKGSGNRAGDAGNDAPPPTDGGDTAEGPGDATDAGDVPHPMDVAPEISVDAPEDMTDAVIETSTDSPVEARGTDATNDTSAGDAGTDATPSCPGPLVGYYKFEETTGPVVDSSACAHDGDASTPVVRGVSGVGNAASFGAAGSYVAVPGIDSSLLDGDFTFEAWVYREAGQGGAIVSITSGGGPEGVWLWAASDGTVNLSLGDPACTGMTNWGGTTNKLASGAWSHVAADMLRGSSAGLRYFHLYIDGTFSLSSVGVQATLCHDSNDRLTIGAVGPAASLPWLGRIDEVKVWSVSRSRDEVCADAGGVYGSTCDVSAVRPQ